MKRMKDEEEDGAATGGWGWMDGWIDKNTQEVKK